MGNRKVGIGRQFKGRAEKIKQALKNRSPGRPKKRTYAVCNSNYTYNYTLQGVGVG